jgi:hypothetical protein
MGMSVELIYYHHPPTQAVGESWVGDRARLAATDPAGSEKF